MLKIVGMKILKTVISLSAITERGKYTYQSYLFQLPMQFDNTIPTTGQKGRNRFIMTFDTIRQSDKNGVSAVDDDDNDDKLIRMVLMMTTKIMMMLMMMTTILLLLLMIGMMTESNIS